MRRIRRHIPESGPGCCQRLGGWFGGLTGKAGDVLPVRVGGTEYRQSSTTTPASVLGYDQALLWVVVALLAWGW